MSAVGLHCTLRTDPGIVGSRPLKAQFEMVETIVKTDHWWRYLLRCRCCGTLYLFTFYETIDWASGRDPQTSTWIPVASEEDAVPLRDAPMDDLSGFVPRLVKDWPSGLDAPEIKWVL